MNSLVNNLSFLRGIDLTDQSCWRRIGRVVVISWILFFIFEFITMVSMWAQLPILGEVWVIISALLIVSFITMVPGGIALAQHTIRKNLYTIPEAAALSAFTLSFLLGFGLLFGFNLLFYLIDESSRCWYPPCDFFNVVLEPLLAGLAVGIFAFPVTMGLVFPFGICVGCALIVWVVIDEVGLYQKSVGTLMLVRQLLVGYFLLLLDTL